MAWTLGAIQKEKRCVGGRLAGVFAGMKFWLFMVMLASASVVLAQESQTSEAEAGEAIAEATGEEVTIPAGEVAVEGDEESVSSAPDSEDAAVVEEDAAADAGELPAAPADAEPIVAEDIIPMAPMPDLALPDESFVESESLFIDEPPPPPTEIAIESQAEKERELMIRYREVRMKADEDPEVTAMRERAEAATSIEDQRAAYREYYRLLFDKVARLDKSLKQKAKVMTDAYTRRLAQMRLEPTIPLNPPPTPEPLD
jgi:hypothetical protein